MNLTPFEKQTDFDILLINLKDLGVSNCCLFRLDEHSGNRKKHRDTFLNFLFIKSGSLDIQIDQLSKKVKGPCMIYIMPGQVHSYQVQHDSYIYFLGLEEYFLSKIAYKTLYNVAAHPINQIVTKSPYSDDIFTMIDILERQLNESNTFTELSFLLSKTIVQMIVATIDNQTNERKQYIHSNESALLNQFSKLLSENFRNIKSPKQYAKIMGISTSYLNKQVVRSKGITAGQMIKIFIMSEAKRLLVYTKLSIGDIARNLGYEDVAYFSRVFSKAEGLSPYKFRRNFSDNPRI